MSKYDKPTQPTDLGLHPDAPWCCAGCGYPPDACGCGKDETPTQPTASQYVAWDYEADAVPPHYHVFSLDREYASLDLAAGLFTIATLKTAEMDDKITALCKAFDEVIAKAMEAINGRQ